VWCAVQLARWCTICVVAEVGGNSAAVTLSLVQKSEVGSNVGFRTGPRHLDAGTDYTVLYWCRAAVMLAGVGD
jgi:hypothetical protein